ncbi:MAG: cell division protein ZapA [Alphaproteobacteria bacterium]|nr:cell division protein ZapA [Alphaproteobacteria bacterium]
MPLVNVMVNSRAYTIACDDGEEEHLRELAAHVDSKVRELLEQVGQVGDQRLILMAALLITDDYLDARQRLDARAAELGEVAGARDAVQDRLARAEGSAVESLEAAAKRLEGLAAKLAAA